MKTAHVEGNEYICPDCLREMHESERDYGYGGVDESLYKFVHDKPCDYC